MNQHRPTALYVLRSILSGLYHFIGARDREHPWRLVGDLGSGSNVLISLQKEVFGRRGIWGGWSEDGQNRDGGDEE